MTDLAISLFTKYHHLNTFRINVKLYLNVY